MAEIEKNILDEDLSPEAEQALRERLESWREDVYSNLMEEAEQEKESKIEELEEANIEYREQLKEEYAGKMMDALKEMKEELHAEVLAEVYENNPELKVLEQIKEIIAPTLDEDYISNVFANELQTLKERVEELEYEKLLDEGARTLADLIAPYSKKTQNIFLSLIKEGGPDEITEQFYSLLESFETEEENEESDEEDDDSFDDEEDDEEEESNEDSEETEEDDSEETEEDDSEETEEDDSEDDDDEETEESTEDEGFETYIQEDAEGDKKPEKKVNKLTEDIKRLSQQAKM